MADQILAPQQSNRKELSFTENLTEPFSRLRNELDHLLGEYPIRWPSFNLASRIAPSLPIPAVQMTESDDAYKVSVEVPGMTSKDIELSIEKDMLVLKGEKLEEREENERDYARSERTYGCFERHIALPVDIDAENIKAQTDNGVLTIDIPRNKEASANARKIPIGAAD